MKSMSHSPDIGAKNLTALLSYGPTKYAEASDYASKRQHRSVQSFFADVLFTASKFW